MHILFIGYSNVLRKRILPFLHGVYEISKIDIAVYKNQSKEDICKSNFYGTIFENYSDAIKESKA
ncbi:MAG: hypothetical protein NTY95_18360, partial [Bacteroidia bacterium]|nr:hypothetical protein [Bacteroidia bacterium]